MTLCSCPSAAARTSLFIYSLNCLFSLLRSLSVVFYNSYLPILVNQHPEIAAAPSNLRSVIYQVISNDMSTIGYIFGYVGSVLVSLVAIALSIFISKEDDLNVRAILCFGGFWWAAFSIYSFLYLKEHPGKQLQRGEWLMAKGWISTATTLKQAAACPQTFKFLVAYFFYSDSYSTIVTVGVLLMKDVMCMKPLQLGIILLEVFLLAVLGNAMALRIQRRFKIQTKFMIFGCLSGYMFLSAFSLLGLIRNSPVGLKSIPEAYLFAAVHGLIIGAVQSYSRTIFCDLLIPGKEAEFFALYEITDKGSSWLGSFSLLFYLFPPQVFFRTLRNCRRGLLTRMWV
jgi:UMF1 family MFS transporter